MKKFGSNLKEIITASEIKNRIEELGKKISADYENKELVLVGVLKGCFVFMADLIRSIDIPIEVDFIEVSSYESTASSGIVRITKDLKNSIEGKDVLIVEDIVDTGLTMKFLVEHLNAQKPRSLKIASFLVKSYKHKLNFEIEYRCFEIEDFFVVGYGLDCDGKFRNLPSVMILD